MKGCVDGLGVTSPRFGPSPHLVGPRISASGASGYSPHPTHLHPHTSSLNSGQRQVPGLMVLSSQGPRVEILAKNLRVKDQMPQGAPR